MEFYTKAFFVALAAVVAYGMTLVLQPFAGSMAWAIFLAFLLFPLHRWLTRKFRGKAGMSAGVITGLTPFALLTPLTFLAFEFINQARALVQFVRGSDFKLDGSILIRHGLRILRLVVVGGKGKRNQDRRPAGSFDFRDSRRTRATDD